jgi:subtilase family serine protease
MSWGGGESSSETFFDSYFSYPGVTFLASSGDTGGIVEWPAVSPYVIGVGGTQLATNPSTGRLATPVQETAWSGSGGGCSLYEASLAAQNGFVPSTCKKRASPDVSMDGGAASPVAVYISLQGGWYDVWGTSLSVQVYAGIVGLMNGLRSTPLSSTLADLYAAATKDGYPIFFRDITSGTAGSFSAGPGWDFVTGLGSPMARLIAYVGAAGK